MKSEAIADATKIPLWNVFNACATFNVNIFIMFDDNIIHILLYFPNTLNMLLKYL